MGATRVRRAVLAAMAVLGVVAPSALAAPVVRDGVTQPVFSYEDAIRETVFVELPVDGDRDGVPDRVAADVIRPREPAQARERVPAIMDASPYYSCCGRGNEGERKLYDDAGRITRFPLFYDNFFVPRGYAFVAVDLAGTNRSTGCADIGARSDVVSAQAVVDWLNGRARGFRADGSQALATWSDGRVGMIGKSYDGTIANGTAATAVQGLETIVPISAISSWYDYYRSEGLVWFPQGASGLFDFVSGRPEAACAAQRADLVAGEDDATGDLNAFWDARDYVPDARRVNASVFLVHGLNDLNVQTDQAAQWWEALRRAGVQRKIWLGLPGHVDPFDFRRAEWVATLHRWFDHELHGIDNGILDEPRATIERAPGVFVDEADWPAPGTRPTVLSLGPAQDGRPGTLSTEEVRGAARQSFTDDPEQTEEQMVAEPGAAKPSRLLFLTAPLARDLRISGSARLNLRASVDRPTTHLTALLLDLGRAERLDYLSRGEGIRTLDVETCWGASTAQDDACYRETERTLRTSDLEIVARGWLDAANRRSLRAGRPLVPGRPTRFHVPLLPHDHVVPAGHQLGLVVAGSDPDQSVVDLGRARVTVELDRSSLVLPVVGGAEVPVGSAAPAEVAAGRGPGLREDERRALARERRGLDR